jgi:hypothetical protein
VGAFEYLSVLLSIILGLAVAQILTGYRSLVLARARVLTYQPTLIWMVVVLLIAVQSWWAMFGLREVAAWTFGGFMILLLQAILIYMLAGLSLPDVPAEGDLDLRVHYHLHRRLFFGLVVVLVGVSLSKDLVFSGRLPTPLNVAFQGGLALVSAIAMVTKAPWYHRVLAPAVLIVFAAYVALLFWR